MKKIKMIAFAALAVFLATSCKNDLILKTEQKTPIAVEWIDIGQVGSNISLVKATTRQLQVKVLPENAADKKLIYSSAKGNIASIDSVGLITAKEVGNTSITIKAANDVQREITVTVTPEPIPVEDIVFEEPVPASLVIGDTYNLKAKAQPDTATDKALTYTVDNDNVFIDGDGTVTARNDGPVTITVTALNKGKNAVTKTVTFTVKKKPEIKIETKELDALISRQLTHIDNIDFHRYEISHRKIESLKFSFCSFRGAFISYSSFTNCNFINCSFVGFISFVNCGVFI